MSKLPCEQYQLAPLLTGFMIRLGSWANKETRQENGQYEKPHSVWTQIKEAEKGKQEEIKATSLAKKKYMK